MRILIFTEGTALIFLAGRNLPRKKCLEMSQQAGVQREQNTLAYENNNVLPEVKKGSVYDFASYVPIGNAVEKLTSWKKHGATITYLTSRRIQKEVEMIRTILQKYNFPDYQNLLYRNQGEDYKDIAEKIMPNVLIEDDCESIGGEKEMVYPHMRPELQKKIKSVVIPEFGGIGHLPDDIKKL